MPPVWILTFNRPLALNRLIKSLGEQGLRCNVFSNHPVLHIDSGNEPFVDERIINTLNSSESSSWCARSWNTIMMKAFPTTHDVILLQDDTVVAPAFAAWIEDKKKTYHFIWGPMGDQFHYTTIDVLKAVGWWDERYIGCYCGDFDYMKRVLFSYDPEKVCIEEHHAGPGFVHNACGVSKNIIVDLKQRAIDPGYENQHWQFERMGTQTISHAEAYYQEKWGIHLVCGTPAYTHRDRRLPEIDWYPWFTKKYLC